MCGHKRRAARRAECGYVRPRPAQAAVIAIIDGIQQMRIASQQQQASIPTATRATELGQQTRGVIYHSVDDEKTDPLQRENGEIQFEVLPTYEEVTQTRSPRPTAVETVTVPTRPIEEIDTATARGLSTLPNSQSVASKGLHEFNLALNSYRNGARGGRRQAKRAARNLVHELVIQERARIEASHGPLACGQRKQIRKDLNPVKAILKNAVREVKREYVN